MAQNQIRRLAGVAGVAGVVGPLWVTTALLLVACDKLPPRPQPQPRPITSQGQTSPLAPAVTLPDTSVPSAAAVLATPAAPAKTELPGARTNAPLTAAQESNAMPMAGQANDHSAPQASAPSAGVPSSRP